MSAPPSAKRRRPRSPKVGGLSQEFRRTAFWQTGLPSLKRARVAQTPFLGSAVLKLVSSSAAGHLNNLAKAADLKVRSALPELWPFVSVTSKAADLPSTLLTVRLCSPSLSEAEGREAERLRGLKTEVRDTLHGRCLRYPEVHVAGQRAGRRYDLHIAGGRAARDGGRDFRARLHRERSRRAVEGDAGRALQIVPQDSDGRSHLAGGGPYSHERTKAQRQAEDRAIAIGPPKYVVP